MLLSSLPHRLLKIYDRYGQSPAATLKSPSAHRIPRSHQFRQSGVYRCRPDSLELAARLSP